MMLLSGKMTCGAIHSLTFSEQVGAFLDLGIAFLLLCASTLAYFASKFLGLFGLCLPCPCKGHIGSSRSGPCLQRALLDRPREKASSVQLSVKSTLPFDLTWADDPNYQFNLGWVDERNRKNKNVDEKEGEELSSSSYMEKAQDFVGRSLVGSYEAGLESAGMANAPTVKQGRHDLKGKRVADHRKRLGLRQRHKRRIVDYGKSDPLHLDAKNGCWTSSSNVYKIGTEIIEEGNSVPVNSAGDGWEALVDISWRDRVSCGVELNEFVDKDKSTKKNALPVEESSYNTQREVSFDSNKTHTVRVLEQALEEEHAARAALYLELEKERCAAASAAEEAMAMILRLQEEKALIEMEAKQYHRMIEEKSAYDAEEMDILKEILLRREREKHFLEKEVEAYRQMIFGNDQLDADMETTQEPRISSLLYSSEGQMLMLQQISKSLNEKERLEDTSSSREYEVPYLDLQNRILAFGKELPYPELDEEADFSKKGDIRRHPSLDKQPNSLSFDEFREEGMVSMDENPVTQRRELHTIEASSQLTQSSTEHGFNLHAGSIKPVREGHEQSDNMSLSQSLATKTVESCNEDKIDSAYTNQEDKVTHTSFGDIEPCVHDVHVIDDESHMSREDSIKKSKQFSRNASLNLYRKGDIPTLSKPEIELDFNRSRPDISSGLPPKVPSRSKAPVSDLRRKSMSAIDFRRNSMSPIDNERLKIDNEVEWLQERLRIVQGEREKLNFSLGNKEREKVQLQLLEDIAGQLQEIRQLTEPGKAVRQASLPPPSSKVMSKKRCWRSASLEVR
ncbi:hypothetical protein FH972_014915 [Carpinus fangiana]|uniref:GTD-binding domain-containing protein n=1 Tax=Carpinus fangiana TaxID=176857 RepID=A0A5N6RBH5_9ROSI|nr:hypothetical protein FH972_014915 [Carpinus fangiana]